MKNLHENAPTPGSTVTYSLYAFRKTWETYAFVKNWETRDCFRAAEEAEIWRTTGTGTGSPISSRTKITSLSDWDSSDSSSELSSRSSSSISSPLDWRSFDSRSFFFSLASLSSFAACASATAS